jgi:hypothetical protein
MPALLAAVTGLGDPACASSRLGGARNLAPAERFTALSIKFLSSRTFPARTNSTRLESSEGYRTVQKPAARATKRQFLSRRAGNGGQIRLFLSKMELRFFFDHIWSNGRCGAFSLCRHRKRYLQQTRAGPLPSLYGAKNPDSLAIGQRNALSRSGVAKCLY